MVYTWANGSDPARIELKSQYRPPVSVDDDDDDDGEEPAEGDEAAQAAAEARRKMKYDGVQRDRDNGELRWSVRSLERFLPWWKGELVLVAPRGQVPDWLDETNDRVRIVAQEDIVPEEANPTFNTNAIEQFLYKIPNLPSTFVHLNDDFFFASPIWPWELFTEHGHPLVHYEATKLHGGTEIYEKLLIEHPEYAWFASVFRTNGAIYEKFHVWQNYIRHAPMVYYRDVFPIFHDLFGDLLRNTSTSRFRSPHDMVTPYLHHGITLSHEYSSEYPVGALPVHEAIDEVYVMIRVTDDMQLTVDEVVKYLFDGSKDQRDDEDNDKEDGGEVRLPPRPKVKMFVLNDDYGKDVGQSAFIQKVLETYYGDLRSSFEK
ncbi:hypothetical protein DFJ73DRAFT_807612 [Zopfochytrium polystomum]|nr:hypothetical protein DFJ73DRAFT_807612 [Zopfochytrium polystomum]